MTYRNVEKLEEINFTDKDHVSFEASIIEIYSEGQLGSSDKRKPCRFLFKLESTGELLIGTTWVKEMIDTIKGGVESIKVFSVSGYCSVYNDARQISVDELKFTGKESTQKYIGASRRSDAADNSGDYASELRSIFDKYIKTQCLRDIIENLVFMNADFPVWPAATRMHHAFPGGLLMHTLFVAKNAASFAETYKSASDDINIELVVAGAILHDVGKLYEYNSDGSRTLDGDLFGHIYIGARMIEEFFNKYIQSNPITPTDCTLVKYLTHIVLAHHELQEYGTVAKPFIIEAYMVTRSDASDATFEEVFETLNYLSPGTSSLRAVPGTENRILRKGL